MKFCHRAFTPLLLLITSTSFAQAEVPANNEQQQDPAHSPKQEQVIQGTNAGGHAQTTVIDVNGNLKLVKPGEEGEKTAEDKEKSGDAQRANSPTTHAPAALDSTNVAPVTPNKTP